MVITGWKTYGNDRCVGSVLHTNYVRRSAQLQTPMQIQLPVSAWFYLWYWQQDMSA